MKRAIGLTVTAILVVFTAILALTMFGGLDLGFGSKNTLTVYYNNALGGREEKNIKASVPVYAYQDDYDYEDTEIIYETRENTTKLPNGEKDLKFVRAGYTWVGWKYGFGGDFIDDDYVPAGLTAAEGIITFVSVWEANSYFVSFNPDYPGLDAPANIRVTAGEPMVGLDASIVADPNGTLEFKGWRTQKNGKGALLRDGDICDFSQHTMLFAWWGNKNGSGNTVVNKGTYTLAVVSCLYDSTEGPFKSFVTVESAGQAVFFDMRDYDVYKGYWFEYFIIGTTRYYRAQLINNPEIHFNMTNNTLVTVVYSRI